MDIDGPEINIPTPDVPDPKTPNAPPDLTYGVYPNVESYDLPGNGGPVQSRGAEPKAPVSRI